MASEQPRPGGGHLGAFDIGCVVVGGIIGVGIFFTPRAVAAAVDSPAMMVLAWGLGGVLAVLGALVFAELSVLVPGHGGIFRYILAAFGRLPAFVYGWANWLVIQAGAQGVVALVLIDHVELLAWGGPRLGPHAKVALAAAAVLTFTAVNVFGLRVGKRVQNSLTVLKVGALLFLVAVAVVAGAGGPAAEASAPAVGPDGPSRSVPGMLAAALLPVLFATGGWQQGSFLAGAARRPLRDVPLGILAGVLVVVVTYLSVNLAYLRLLGFDGARGAAAIGAAAAGVALGEAGGRVFAAMVVVSAAGILNTISMAPPWVLYAMAEAKVFPAAFARLHPRWQTPVLGVLGQGLWSVVLLATVHLVVHWRSDGGSAIATLDFVCNGVVFVDWLFFALCGLSLLRLRRRGHGLRVPGGAAVAVLFTLGALLVTAGAIWQQPGASLAGLLIAAVGLPAAFVLRPRGAG